MVSFYSPFVVLFYKYGCQIYNDIGKFKMESRKLLQISYKVKTSDFHNSNKYRLASTVSVISKPKPGYLGVAIAVESNGDVHLITHGANLTKRQILDQGLSKGNRFMCVGEIVREKKNDYRFEMIIDDVFQIQWDEN